MSNVVECVRTQLTCVSLRDFIVLYTTTGQIVLWLTKRRWCGICCPPTVVNLLAEHLAHQSLIWKLLRVRKAEDCGSLDSSTGRRRVLPRELDQLCFSVHCPDKGLGYQVFISAGCILFPRPGADDWPVGKSCTETPLPFTPRLRKCRQHICMSSCVRWRRISQCPVFRSIRVGHLFITQGLQFLVGKCLEHCELCYMRNSTLGLLHTVTSDFNRLTRKGLRINSGSNRYPLCVRKSLLRNRWDFRYVLLYASGRERFIVGMNKTL